MGWYIVWIPSSTWHINLCYHILDFGEVNQIFETSWVQLPCHIQKTVPHSGCPVLGLWHLQSFYPILSDVPYALCVWVVL